MTVSPEIDRIRLSGPATVEDAEALVAALQAAPALPVDWSDAGPLHTAVLQALLVLRPRLIGTPSDPFNEAFLRPQFQQVSADRAGHDPPL